MRILTTSELRPIISDRLGQSPRVAVCGVGNELRGDDAIGLDVVNRLAMLPLPSSVVALSCGEVPENFVSDIVRHEASHLLIVDAANMGLSAGTMVLLEISEVDSRSVSSHRLPLSVLSRIVINEIGRHVDVFLLGVQVLDCTFGHDISPIVRQAGDQLRRALADVLLGRFGETT